MNRLGVRWRTDFVSAFDVLRECIAIHPFSDCAGATDDIPSIDTHPKLRCNRGDSFRQAVLSQLDHTCPQLGAPPATPRRREHGVDYSGIVAAIAAYKMRFTCIP